MAWFLIKESICYGFSFLVSNCYRNYTEIHCPGNLWTRDDGTVFTGKVRIHEIPLNRQLFIQRGSYSMQNSMMICALTIWYRTAILGSTFISFMPWAEALVAESLRLFTNSDLSFTDNAKNLQQSSNLWNWPLQYQHEFVVGVQLFGACLLDDAASAEKNF